MFDGFRGNVNTEVGAVSVVCDLDVDGETLRVLKQPQTESLGCSRTDEPCWMNNFWKVWNGHLSVELQFPSPGSVGVDGEISRFVDDAAQRLQTGTETFHLRRREHIHHVSL